ncbi:hypothetical protein AV521_31860 [Streptomyces sp. IMTB 2501]|uniref:Rv1733c family protein n=1 Tax=Streptomyces sp. IMTB 2501 TaxID=1776340 RepID=UPI00097010AE|nr:hypothetical protein [Streptomyces sp. IMTB 2501]OLZ65422.1 hypothetical protein AV521_31860 [Streptomyces sp. IMTB 2501]
MAPTPSTTVTPVRLWHWRPNPLRRHSDVVEGWIVLAIWTLAVLAGVVAGVLAAQAVDRPTRVHAVSAVLTDDAARTPVGTGGYDDGRVWAAVRWTDADGSVHKGQAKFFPGAPVGTRITVWTDANDRVVSAPLTGGAATLQAVMAGVLVAPSVGATVWGGGRVVRARLIRRRMAEWDEEWQQIGPQWGGPEWRKLR